MTRPVSARFSMAGFLTGLKAITLVPILTAFYSSCAILFSFFEKDDGKLSHRMLTRPWGRDLTWASGLRLRIEGLENLQGSIGPFIVAFNHQSNLDIPVLYGALPLQIRFVAKAELLRVPIMGPAMKRLGNIVIDRKNRAEAMAGLKAAEKKMREQQLSVVMAPEGTRSTDGKLLPFKKGAFVLAVDTGIPILPVTLVGTFAALPKGKFISRGGAVRVIVGKPIPTGGMTYADRQKLMDAVRNEMEKHL